MNGLTPKANPDVFLNYQQALLRATKANQVIVVEKSRRTGFSWAAAADATLTAGAKENAGGMDVFYMGYNLEMAREFIHYVSDWAQKFGEAISDIEDTFFKDPDNPEKDVQPHEA